MKTYLKKLLTNKTYLFVIALLLFLLPTTLAKPAQSEVKAIAVGAESNVLTFTVMPTQNEILASQYFIDAEDEIILDKNAKTAKTATQRIPTSIPVFLLRLRLARYSSFVISAALLEGVLRTGISRFAAVRLTVPSAAIPDVML